MLSRDKLRQSYAIYLDRCEMARIEEEKMTFDEYIRNYYVYLEDEGGY